jgi:hypothetical protein
VLPMLQHNHSREHLCPADNKVGHGIHSRNIFWKTGTWHSNTHGRKGSHPICNRGAELHLGREKDLQAHTSTACARLCAAAIQNCHYRQRLIQSMPQLAPHILGC